MNDREAWLDGRRPVPPAELRRAVSEGLEQAEAGRPIGSALAAAARDRLRAALAHPGRVRASGFELLAADALITYACEAALESEDPEATLLEVVEVAVAP